MPTWAAFRDFSPKNPKVNLTPVPEGVETLAGCSLFPSGDTTARPDVMSHIVLDRFHLKRGVL